MESATALLSFCKEGLGMKIVNHKVDVLTDRVCSVKTGKSQVRLCFICSPPSFRTNGFSITKFFVEWSAYLD